MVVRNLFKFWSMEPPLSVSIFESHLKQTRILFYMQIGETTWSKITLAAFLMTATGVSLCVFFYYYMIQ
jgi:hypothetical protein